MKNKEKIKLIMLVLVLPIFLISIISTYAVTGLLSSEVSYDRSTSKLRSNNVQDAIDELNNKYKNAEELKCPIGKKCTKVYTLTINPNGGSYNGSTSLTRITRKEGEEYTILTPTKEGYTFTGWTFSGMQNGTKSENTYTFGEGNDTIIANYEKVYKCKRAPTLHEATCQSASSLGCLAAGYSSGASITYGQLGTSGTLSSGDAFDCDVNGDGTYDSTTERFYYVSNYYDTSTKSFNSSYAVLIYYSNVYGTTIDNTSKLYYSRKSSACYNCYGPDNLIGGLPSTSQWSNISLYKEARAILTETGTTSTSGGTLPSSYSYSGKAARFLTYQELKSGCSEASTTTGLLDTCAYLMENTDYQNSNYAGYYLETPVSSSDRYIWTVSGSIRKIYTSIGYNQNAGIRPVIEVLKSDIDY